MARGRVTRRLTGAAPGAERSYLRVVLLEERRVAQSGQWNGVKAKTL